MRLRPSPAVLVGILVMFMAAIVPLRSIFDGNAAFGRVAAATIVAGLLAALFETTRAEVTLPTRGLNTLATAYIWCLVVVRWDTFSSRPAAPSTWAQVPRDFFGGWTDLLQAGDGFPVTQPAEVFLVVVLWTSITVSVVAAARMNSALISLAVATVVLWLCAAAVLPQGLPSVLAGAAIGAAALTMVAVTANQDDRTFGGWRPARVLSLAAMIGLAGVLGAALAIAADPIGNDPIDPRAGVGTTLTDRNAPDLLSDLATLRSNDRLDLVVAVTSGTEPTPIRLRLVTYGNHDGTRFVPEASLDDVRLVREPEVPPQGSLLTLDITPAGYAGPYVPLLDRLIGLDLRDLGYDEESQVVVVNGSFARYELTGTVIADANLDGLAASRTEDVEPYRTVPVQLPEEIRTAAFELVDGAPDDISAVRAITEFVATLGRDDSVPTGHSLGRLRLDLTERRSADVEQLAALHTLMVRAVGIPARLVVGYVSDDLEIRSSELQAWTEIAYPGIGWIPTEPVANAPQEVSADEPPPTTTIPESNDVQAQALPRELGPGEDRDVQGDSGPLSLGELLLYALVVIAASIGLLHGLRRVRRARRENSSEAAHRTLGAWAELVDRLRESGFELSAADTIGDVVDRASEMDPRLVAPAQSLGRLASDALHGPADTLPEVANAAWNELEEAEEIIVEITGPATMLRRTIDPRILRYRAPVPPPHRDGGRRSLLATEAESSLS